MKRSSLVFFKRAAVAADAFGDQNAAHARRPYHAGGMELDKFHIHQIGAQHPVPW